MNNISGRTVDSNLKKSLLSFRNHIEAFLNQCVVVNMVLHARESIDRETHAQLSSLENLIAVLFVRSTLEGEDTAFAEQLLTLVIGYRESLLQIGKLYAELGQEHYSIPLKGKTSQVIAAIDDLYLRLQTITASIPDVARSGEKIASNVQKYREAILIFNEVMEKLNSRMTDIHHPKASLTSAMENIEKKISSATQLVRENIEKTIFSSGAAVLAVSFCVIVFMGPVTAYLMKTTIKDPMNAILEGVGSFRTGDLDKSIELNREDEWDAIEQGLNKMAADLSKSYTALKKNELFLEAIIENIPDMIFVKDAEELRFVRFNKAGEDLLGHDRQALIGRNDYDFFPKEEADFFTKKDRKVLNSGTLLDIPEEPILTQYKGERILHTKKLPLMDEQGQPEYLLGISEDITESKFTEKALGIQRDLGMALSSTSNMTEALNQLLEATLKIEGIDSGGVYLADARTGGFDLIVHCGLSSEFVERVSHYEHDSREIRIVMEGRPLYSHNSDFKPAADEQLKR